MEEAKIELYEDQEIERIKTAQEEKKSAPHGNLERCREIIKKSFPDLKIEETLEVINKIKDNPRCNSCTRYYPQSNITDVKAKLKGKRMERDQGLFLRIYKNSAEKLENSKGYCCYTIGRIYHIKTMIPVPDMSLCSDWILHHDLQTYFIAIHEILNEKEAKENKILEKKKFALEQKKRAEQIIKEYHENYEKDQEDD